MITGKSWLLGYYWEHVPGCRAHLTHDNGTVVATVKSPSIGRHVATWKNSTEEHANLYAAQRAIEQSVSDGTVWRK